MPGIASVLFSGVVVSTLRPGTSFLPPVNTANTLSKSSINHRTQKSRKSPLPAPTAHTGQQADDKKDVRDIPGQRVPVTSQRRQANIVQQRTALRELEDHLIRFGRTRMWRNGLDAINQARRSGIPLNARMYTCAINVMGQGGRWKEALDLLDTMTAEGVKPTLVSYNAALHACSRASRWEASERIMDRIRAAGLTPDLYTFSTILSGCARAGRADRAISLLNSMQEDVGIEPNQVCYASAMDACRGAGAWERAQDILQRMCSAGIEPTPVIYLASIGSCVQQGKGEVAVEFLERMKAASGATVAATSSTSVTDVSVATSNSAVAPAPNLCAEPLLLPAYAAVANAYARDGKPDRVCDLLSEMRAGGLKPQVEHLNALTAALAMSGNWEEAVESLEEARVAKVGPDTVGYNHAIVGCVRAGEWQKALQVLDWLRGEGGESGVRPDMGSFNAGLEACAMGGDANQALELLGEMEKASSVDGNGSGAGGQSGRSGGRGRGRGGGKGGRRGMLRPDKVSYGFAITACGLSARWNAALGLLEKMRQGGVRPDQRCYIGVIAAFVEGGEMVRAAVMAETMRDDGVRLSKGGAKALKDIFKQEGIGKEVGVRGLGVIEEMLGGNVPEVEARRTEE